MAEKIELRARGQVYAGFESVDIVRTLDALCGSFAVTVDGRPKRTRQDPSPIQAGDPIEILIGGELYLTGFVDALGVSFRKGAHEITIEGRDVARDLVDCSPYKLPTEFYSIGLLELAKQLCDPFFLNVRFEVFGEAEPEPFERFPLTIGDSAHASLERACRLRGFLLASDNKGTIVITRPGARAATTFLCEGRGRGGTPIESAALRIDNSARHHLYVVHGQMAATDERFGADAAEVQAAAIDGSIQRWRTLSISSEGAIDAVAAQQRANWEASVRAARAHGVTAVVSGFRENFDRGALWAPGPRLPARLPSVGADGEYLVAATKLSYSKRDGQHAELVLARPDAYLPEPPKPENEPSFEPLVEDER